MQFIEISQCKIIDFKPLKPWPNHLPPICAGNELIAGFCSPFTVAVQPSANFEELLGDCYPALSLPELARLFKLKPQLNWPSLCERYRLRFTDDLESVLKILVETPSSFQKWVSEKDLGIKDLLILKLSWNDRFLIKIAELNCGKQWGCRILEWGIELAPKVSWNQIMEKSDQVESWYKDLFQLRFPQTSERDRDREMRVLQTPWPRHVDAQWKRTGDKAGIEIRFTAISGPDFQQKIDALTKIGNKVEKIWST